MLRFVLSFTKYTVNLDQNPSYFVFVQSYCGSESELLTSPCKRSYTCSRCLCEVARQDRLREMTHRRSSQILAESWGILPFSLIKDNLKIARKSTDVTGTTFMGKK